MNHVYIPFSKVEPGEVFWSIDAKGEPYILAVRVGNLIGDCPRQPEVRDFSNPFKGITVNAVALNDGVLNDGDVIKRGQVLIVANDEAVIHVPHFLNDAHAALAAYRKEV